MMAAWTSYSILKVVSCRLYVADIVNAALRVDVCNMFPINFSSLYSVYDGFHF